MSSTELQIRIDAEKKEQFKKLCGNQGMAEVIKNFIDEYIKRNGKIKY